MSATTSDFGIAPCGPPWWRRTLTGGFHVATTDDEHRVDALLLGVGDLGFIGPLPN